MTLGDTAREVAQFPVDQVAVPLRVGVETGYSQLGHQTVNLFVGQDASLVPRRYLHDVGPQTSGCLDQLHSSVVAESPRQPGLGNR